MTTRLRTPALTICITALMLGACSQKTAEEKGKEMATEKIDLVKGIGDAVTSKGGQAAESLAQGAGVILQGAGKGLDKAMAWKISEGAGLRTAGLSVTRLQAGAPSEAASKALDAYVVANKNVTGVMQLIAYDVNQRELARVRKELSIQAGDGRYEALPLDVRTDVNAIHSASVDFTPASTVAPVPR
jgi:hypothetical protein